jgi:adenine deaminase
MRLLPDEAVLDVALRRRPAESVLVGGEVMLVHTGEIVRADVAVAAGRIATVGAVTDLIGPGTQVHDVAGQFVLPGFLDGHLHLESGKLSVGAAAQVLTAAGTTSVVTGFDHTAAVAGREGVRACLDEAAASDLQVFWAAPFRLPYTLPEATILRPWTPADHEIAQAWPECVGVWELAGPWLERKDPATLEAVRIAARNGLGVYGSVPAAGDTLDVVAAHVAAGLRIDHEANDPDELLAKLRLGMHGLIRDSAVERFLERLLPLLIERPHLAHLVGFCTDGFDARHVRTRGHLGRLVADAVALGLPAVTAVQMATLNTARAYGLESVVGSVTPGVRADLVVCPDLVEFRPALVFAGGRLVARDGFPLGEPAGAPVTAEPFARAPVLPAELRIDAPRDGVMPAHIIRMDPENAFHRLLDEVEVTAEDGEVRASPESDVALLAYVDRGGRTPAPGVGLVSGFGLRAGALATSSSPDDENLLCVGTDAADMALALNTVIAQGGGDVVVVDGQVAGNLPLPVFGLMSDRPADELMRAQDAVEAVVRGLGCTLVQPFHFLGLLAITGVPEAGMSEHGPVEAATGRVLPVLPIKAP